MKSRLSGTAPKVPSEGHVIGTLASEESRRPKLIVEFSPDREMSGQTVMALAMAERKAPGRNALGNFFDTLRAHAARSQSQLFQDVFAIHFCGAKREGYFVEVGTGDGRMISNTYLLEKEFAWRGVVIEANPIFLPSLRKHRTCAIATDCVFDSSGKTVSFQCLPDPEFSGIVSGDLGLDDSDPAKTHRPPGYAEIQLQTITLNDLLEREGAPSSIDYVSIDVEGAELPILRGLDWGRWRIGCLSIEHNGGGARADIHRLLASHGYRRVFETMSYWDDWYVSGELLADRPDKADLWPEDELGPSPDRAASYIGWASEAVLRGDLDAASALCGDALALDCSASGAYRIMADIARRRGHPVAAIDHWKAAIAADPLDYQAHLGLAELLLTREDRIAAFAVLLHAGTLPDDKGAARALLMGARPRAAELDKAIELERVQNDEMDEPKRATLRCPLTIWECVSGFGGAEGPFPEIGLDRQFHWATDSVSSVRIYSPAGGRTTFTIHVRNVLPDQCLSISGEDGMPLSDTILDADFRRAIAIPIVLDGAKGWHSIVITASRQSPAQHGEVRSLAFILQDVTALQD